MGAAVGGAAGLVGGAVVSAMSNDDRTYTRHYVVEHREPSVRYERDVAVGGELPSDMQYYQIEGRPSVQHYRYAVVNDHTVLVDPQTHRIVDVLD